MDQTFVSPLTQIAVLSGAGDRLRVFLDNGPDGRPTQQFDRIDVWNPQARQMGLAMLRALCALHALDPQEFEIRPQTWPDPSSSDVNVFRAGWSLMARISPLETELLERCRRDAHRVAALLQRTPGRTRSPRPRDSASSTSESESRLTLDSLAGEPMLGMRLKASIEVEVTGYPALHIGGVLRRRSTRNFSSETIAVVKVRLRVAKLDGRTRYVSISGVDASSGAAFKEERVRFDEKWRQQIAACIGQSSSQLQMQVAQETLDTGRAKPRRHHKLVGLTILNQSTPLS